MIFRNNAGASLRSPTLPIVVACFLVSAAGCGNILGLDEFSDAPTSASGTGGGSTSSTDATSTATTGTGGMTCEPATTMPCYTGPQGTVDVGQCQSGVQTCDEDGSGYGACEGDVLPGTENCSVDGDEDCNGSACGEGVWALAMGSDTFDFGGDCKVGSGGEVYFAADLGADGSQAFHIGNQTFTPNGGSDALIVKINAGVVEWTKIFGDPDDLSPPVLATVPGSDRFLAAFATGNGTPDFGQGAFGPGGFVVASYDGNGDVVWTHNFSKGHTDLTMGSLTVDPATGDILLIATFRGPMDVEGKILSPAPVSSDYDLMLMRLDSSGNVIWVTSVGDGTGGTSACPAAFAPTGDIWLACEFYGTIPDWSLTSVGSDDIFLAQLDASGSLLQIKSYGDSERQSVTSLVVDSSNNVILGGLLEGELAFSDISKLKSSGPGDRDAYIAKFSSNGFHVWSKDFGDAELQAITSLSLTANDDIRFAGGFDGVIDFGGGPLTSAGDLDIFVGEFTSSGAYVWSRSFGDAAAFQVAGALLDPTDNGTILFGTNDGILDFGTGPLPTYGLGDLFVAKLAP